LFSLEVAPEPPDVAAPASALRLLMTPPPAGSSALAGVAPLADEVLLAGAGVLVAAGGPWVVLQAASNSATAVNESFFMEEENSEKGWGTRACRLKSRGQAMKRDLTICAQFSFFLSLHTNINKF
jgi:hypothetical protein